MYKKNISLYAMRMNTIKLDKMWVVLNCKHVSFNALQRVHQLGLKNAVCCAVEVSTDGRVHTWEKSVNDPVWWLGFVFRDTFWFVPRVCCHAVLVSKLRENRKQEQLLP